MIESLHYYFEAVPHNEKSHRKFDASDEYMIMLVQACAVRPAAFDVL